MKIVMSGGHLTPALAVIHAFKTSLPKTKIVFIGRKFSRESEKVESREQSEMRRLRIPFYMISAAKFHRTYLLRNVHELFRFIPSVKQTYDILKKEKPDLFLSFGGYLAVPVALVCKVLKIPIITHEQTRTAGLANQFIARIATKIAISYEDSRKYFPKERIVLTGNPVRPAFSESFRKKPEWLQVPLTKPLIYITGGSQGSHVINQTVRGALDQLTKIAILVHQCGVSAASQYIRELEEEREKLPTLQKKRYIVREWISVEDVAWLFQHADVVVSRSGANTVQEILMSKVPAIFIPLPFAHNNEQLKNAQALVDQGSAVLLQQKDLIPQSLIETVAQCLRRQVSMRNKSEKIDEDIVVEDAALNLARLCQEVYDQNTKS